MYARLYRHRRPDIDPFEAMTEEEAARWMTAFWDYAESQGAVFPNGRWDKRPKEEPVPVLIGECLP